jgi:hypothetical protein
VTRADQQEAPVTDETNDWQVSASCEVNATAAEVFDWLARPDNHVALDGSGNLRGPLRKGRRMGKTGDKFTMRMHWFLPYAIRSTVSEFVEGELIAWNHFAQHRWRWEVKDLEAGRCEVTETFDASRAPGREKYSKLGYPDSYASVLKKSVAKVAEQFETT